MGIGCADGINDKTKKYLKEGCLWHKGTDELIVHGEPSGKILTSKVMDVEEVLDGKMSRDYELLISPCVLHIQNYLDQGWVEVKC